MSDESDLQPVELATEITIAWLNNPNNRAVAEDVPNFLRTMHATLTELSTGSTSATTNTEAADDYIPAVSVRRSLASKDHILSLIDGKPYKTLTRHLSTNGMTPEEYRRRYKLRPDYPMVAETYAAHRRELAKRIGLGRRPAAAAQSAPQAEGASKPVAAAKPKAVAKKPAVKRASTKAASDSAE